MTLNKLPGCKTFIFVSFAGVRSTNVENYGNYTAAFSNER